jgi:hypothetical protein
MSTLTRFLPLALLVLVFPQTLYAVCASPAGNEGEMVYNSDYKVMQFCNGTDWISMASAYSGRVAGEVSAFNLASCPDGWSEFTAARGRFLRGIDSTGTVDPDGVRAAGSTQAATSIARGRGGGAIGFKNIDGSDGTRSGYILDGSTSFVEDYYKVRPVNVAVLFCVKD